MDTLLQTNSDIFYLKDQYKKRKCGISPADGAQRINTTLHHPEPDIIT